MCRLLLLNNLSLSFISSWVMAVTDAAVLRFLFLWTHFPWRISLSLVVLHHPPIPCTTLVQSTIPIFLMAFPTSSFRPALGLPLSLFLFLYCICINVFMYVCMYVFTLCSPFYCEVWLGWGELREVTVWWQNCLMTELSDDRTVWWQTTTDGSITLGGLALNISHNPNSI